MLRYRDIGTYPGGYREVIGSQEEVSASSEVDGTRGICEDTGAILVRINGAWVPSGAPSFPEGIPGAFQGASIVSGDTLYTWDQKTSRYLAPGAPRRFAMPKARLAYADVVAGVGNMLVHIIGDSHNRGSGQGTGADGTGSGTKNKWRDSPAGKLRKLLEDRGHYAVYDSVIGSGVITTIGTTIAEIQDYDNRVNLTGSYQFVSATAGGGTYKILSGSGVAVFTPDQAWDSWEVVALVGSGQSGSLTVSISGESDFVQPLTGASNPPNPTQFSGQKASVSTGAITVTTTANSNWVLVRVWDSTKSRIEILNWATGGAAVNDLFPVPSGYNQSSVMGLYSPDLTICEIFHNDAVQGIDISTWLAGIERVIVSAQSTGDILMLAGFPGNRAQFAASNLETRYSALADLCNTYSVNLIDLRDLLGATYAEITSEGVAYDTDHWNRRGGGLYARKLLAEVFDGALIQ